MEFMIQDLMQQPPQFKKMKVYFEDNIKKLQTYFHCDPHNISTVQVKVRIDGTKFLYVSVLQKYT